MVTIEHARNAKQKLKEQLAQAGITAAVGIGGDGSNFCLVVRTQSAAPVPSHIDGVSVRHDVTGDIRSL